MAFSGAPTAIKLLGFAYGGDGGEGGSCLIKGNVEIRRPMEDITCVVTTWVDHRHLVYHIQSSTNVADSLVGPDCFKPRLTRMRRSRTISALLVPLTAASDDKQNLSESPRDLHRTTCLHPVSSDAHPLWIHFRKKSSTRSSTISHVPVSAPLLLLRHGGGRGANSVSSTKSCSPRNQW